MAMSRLSVVPVATAAILLSTVPGAAGKDRVRAAIDAPQRCDAAAGTTITVAWRLTTLFGGHRRPFGASGVFVSLDRTAGGTPVKRHARQDRAGHYTVRVKVPDGGIARIRVGLEGTSHFPDGTTKDADVYFPVSGDPCRRR
jgi:hypothetical protein